MRHKNESMLNDMLNYIKDFIIKNSKSPTTYDLADAFNTTRTTAYRYLLELKERGEIRYENGIISTDKLQKIMGRRVNMGVVGSVSCGAPMLEEENLTGYLSFPAELFGTGDFFILYANGESMVDAGIDDGDMLIVRQQPEAHENDLVVALVENENTLKRYQTDDDGRPFLHPENAEGVKKGVYQNIYPDNLVIQGVVTHIIKKAY